MQRKNCHESSWFNQSSSLFTWSNNNLKHSNLYFHIHTVPSVLIKSISMSWCLEVYLKFRAIFLFSHSIIHNTYGSVIQSWLGNVLSMQWIYCFHYSDKDLIWSSVLPNLPPSSGLFPSIGNFAGLLVGCMSLDYESKVGTHYLTWSYRYPYWPYRFHGRLFSFLNMP